jgi:hypothetical protein
MPCFLVGSGFRDGISAEMTCPWQGFVSGYQLGLEQISRRCI